MKSILSKLPAGIANDMRRVYPLRSMYRLTDCQDESREEMYMCQVKEESMRFVCNLKQWMPWVDRTLPTEN